MPLLNFQKQFAPAVILGLYGTEINRVQQIELHKGIGFDENKNIVQPKRRTIRAMRKRPFKDGDRLYLYTGARSKNCKKLGEAIAKEVYTIVINLASETIEMKSQTKYRMIVDPAAFTKFAKQDGFEDRMDFLTFFEPTAKNNVFFGQLIIW